MLHLERMILEGAECLHRVAQGFLHFMSKGSSSMGPRRRDLVFGVQGLGGEGFGRLGFRA